MWPSCVVQLAHIHVGNVPGYIWQQACIHVSTDSKEEGSKLRFTWQHLDGSRVVPEGAVDVEQDPMWRTYRPMPAFFFMKRIQRKPPNNFIAHCSFEDCCLAMLSLAEQRFFTYGY